MLYLNVQKLPSFPDYFPAASLSGIHPVEHTRHDLNNSNPKDQNTDNRHGTRCIRLRIAFRQVTKSKIKDQTGFLGDLGIFETRNPVVKSYHDNLKPHRIIQLNATTCIKIKSELLNLYCFCHLIFI